MGGAADEWLWQLCGWHGGSHHLSPQSQRLPRQLLTAIDLGLYFVLHEHSKRQTLHL